MSTPIEIVGGTLPISCYPGTPSELWAAMWPTLSGMLNENFPGVVVSATEPGPEFQDRIWFNTTNGQWYQFIDGSWTQIPIDKQFLSFYSSFYAVDTGSVNTVVIAFPDRPLDSYAAGLVFWVKVAVSNNGATTLNVDTIGAVSVKKYTSAGISDLVLGDLIAGGIYAFVHDGTQFILINPTPPVSGTAFLDSFANVYSGSDQAWQEYDASASIPLTTPANAAIIELTVSSATANDWCKVEIRKDDLFPTIVAGYVNDLGDPTTHSDHTNIAVIPLSSRHTFDFQVSTMSGGGTAAIRLIGYIA